MKKLIIAAGIAAAVASFGANAKDYTSYASVNTVVTGDSGFSINTTDKSLDSNAFKVSGASLGQFVVQVPTGATTFSLSDIHAHDYPQDYVVKINASVGGSGECVATVGTSGVVTLAGSVSKCDISGVSGPVTLDVTNNSVFTKDVTPGTKTLTVKFTSTVN